MIFFKQLGRIFAIMVCGASFSLAQASTISNQIGWVGDQTVPTICEGYYNEPLLISKQKTGWSVSSDHAVGNLSGNVNLKGNVIIHQSGQLVKANQGYFYRNPKTRKLEKVRLEGRVEIRREGQLILGDSALLFLNDDRGVIKKAIYRLSQADLPSDIVDNQRRWYGLNAWGEAETFEQLADNVYRLKDATYAACPPDKYIWHLEAKTIDVDKNKGFATSQDTRLKIGNQTIFYWPYFSYPTDRRRKSGFLLPSYSHSSRSGDDLAIPYYFNLAPNYDLTVTPHHLGLRGFLTETEGRYLSTTTNADLKLGYLNHDREFGHQKNRWKRMGAPIHSMGTKRMGGEIDYNQALATDWQMKIHYVDVSDDYYFHDLGSNLLIPSQSQLPQQARIHFEKNYLHGEHAYGLSDSRFEIDFSRYKTLHPNDERAIIDQYGTLPRVTYDNLFRQGPFEFQFDAQADYFDWPSRAIVQRVNGKRLGFDPRLSYNMERSYGFLRPSLRAHTRYYSLRDPNKFLAPGLQGVPEHKNLLIPYTTIDTGLYFDKTWTSRYVQTLSPRLYYVYIPRVEQSTLPLFDTGFRAFSFDYLFEPNRFTGGDRLGDTHHLSYALSSEWRDKLFERSLLKFSVGQMRYFRSRQQGFCYGRGCQGLYYISPNADTSPWIGQLKFDWGRHLTSEMNYAWLHDPRYASFRLSYRKLPDKILTLYYDYSRRNIRVDQNGAYIFDKVENFGTAFAWPLRKHWHMLGSWGYNLTDDNAHTYFGGLEYESCCWASRVIAGRKLVYVDVDGQAKYDNAVYLQILIKGLSTLGSSPRSLITASLPDYKDKFKERF